ncbi:MAG: hypothetical protein ACE5Z5_08285 [Candidatus Bathyarchaeia archaeon]
MDHEVFAELVESCVAEHPLALFGSTLSMAISLELTLNGRGTRPSEPV